MLQAGMPTETDAFMPTNGNLQTNQRSALAALWILIAFVFYSPIPTRADAISGKVYGPDGQILKSRSFTVVTPRGPVEFSTDDSGNFSVYLDPGRYTVRPKDDATLEGLVTSYPQPAREDIHLKKKPAR